MGGQTLDCNLLQWGFLVGPLPSCTALSEEEEEEEEEEEKAIAVTTL